MEQLKPMKSKIMQGNCLKTLKTLSDNSIDSIVTDPPYELGFMGKSWDSSGIAFNVDVWQECLRVLKPGGHLLAFSGSRTYHRMACAIEDAGFQIRDQIMWVYGSGFPKSHNVSKAIDKEAGAAPESPNKDKKWEGWGTALKPAHEPIVMARKPLDGTVANNVLTYGVGGLNIDGCRIGEERITINGQGNDKMFHGNFSGKVDNPDRVGRFPANFIHDGSDEVVELFPDKAGAMAPVKSGQKGFGGNIYGKYQQAGDDGATFYNDGLGSAARFFYCAKASKKERNAGGANNHPTVKPTELMRYLCRLITPPNGIVLDPFTGSGSTLVAAKQCGFKYVGCELDKEYIKIARARLKKATK